MSHLKIIALQAENIKKLVAVEIKPDGNLVQITGKNGQGKTSVLDCIWWALAGSSNIQQTPIRKGATSAKIRLDMGEIVVTRTFRPGAKEGITSAITVENAKGLRFTSPQAVLDELLGQLSFDPLAFARMDSAKQFETLKKFVPGVDFEEIEALNKSDYAKRTDCNRIAKEARNVAAAINVSLDGTTERIDEAALLSELELAGKANSDIEARKGRREAVAVEIKSSQDVLAELTIKAVEEAQRIESEAKERAKKVIEVAQAKAKELTTKVVDLLAKLDAAPPLPEPRDLSALRQQIDAAKKKNDEARDRAAKRDRIEKAERFESQAKAFTDAMDARDADKRAKIAAAKLPVKGISFGAGSILMNDVPFEQASDAEQLRASIAIAMALNPKLRVIRVRDGSLLDEESIKLLEEMANEQDYQVWVERVDASGKVGFVLEDGHVKVKEAVAA